MNKAGLLWPAVMAPRFLGVHYRRVYQQLLTETIMSRVDLNDDELAQLLFSRDVPGQIEKIIWAATNRDSIAYPEVVDQITGWVDNPLRRPRLEAVRSGVHPWLFGQSRQVQTLVLTWLKPRPYQFKALGTVTWRRSPPRAKEALVIRKAGDPVVEAEQLFLQRSRNRKLRDFIDSL